MNYLYQHQHPDKALRRRQNYAMTKWSKLLTPLGFKIQHGNAYHREFGNTPIKLPLEAQFVTLNYIIKAIHHLGIEEGKQQIKLEIQHFKKTLGL